METLAKRVKSARLRQGLKQEDLAKLSGLKQSDISKIENGLILKTTGLVALSKALRCDPEWLATGEGEMQPSASVWPFALLTPDQVHHLSPKALQSVENLALSLLEIEGSPPKKSPPLPPVHMDTVVAPRSTGFEGTQPKPEFMKGKSGQRKADPGSSRKTRNG